MCMIWFYTSLELDFASLKATLLPIFCHPFTNKCKMHMPSLATGSISWTGKLSFMNALARSFDKQFFCTQA